MVQAARRRLKEELVRVWAPGARVAEGQMQWVFGRASCLKMG